MKYGIKALIFDFNGTMIFDSEIQRATWHDYMPPLLGRHLTDEEFEKYILGRDNAHIFRMFLGEDISDELVEKLTYGKEAAYRERCLRDPVRFRFVDGLREFLDTAKEKRIPMTIATGSEINNLKFFFEKLELSRWFDFDRVVYDDGSFPGKPAPDTYIRAAKVLDFLPSECLVFEDSYSGVLSAHNAGIGRIAVVNERADASSYESVGGVLAAEHSFLEYISLLDET